jgi:hypothetical protein
MDISTVPLPTSALTSDPKPALIVAIPSDPASAAAFAAGNLFVFLCTPIGQHIASDAEAAGKALGDAIKTLVQDVVNIFRGVRL